MPNPIIAILRNEKLTGNNFVKWKSNMNIVLVCENYKYVLMEECPPVPATNATRILSRHEVVKAVMNAKMKEGTSVRQHVLKIISHINEVEINGAHINEATQLTTFETLLEGKQQCEANIAKAQPSTSEKRKVSAKGEGKPQGEKKKKNKKGKKETALKGKCFRGIDGH
ncbi:hypothetical protein UlMin_037994 [Ulmus minor]